MENAAPDWRRPSNLEAPPPRAGFVQRWIRTGIGNTPDASNVAKKLREGWKPRLASTVPSGFSPPTISHGTLGEVIGVGELVLMEMPRKTVLQRRKFYADITRKQMEGVDRNLLKIERPGMPIQRSFKSETVGPKKAEIASDD